MKFNNKQFVAGFDAIIGTLAASEKVTKATLQTMSRDLLACLHIAEDNPRVGDIGFINKTIAVLTPVNKKVFIAFCKAFTGYALDLGGVSFNGKIKAKDAYSKAQAQAIEWLEDPMNNIWSWADREIDIVPKEFTLEAVTKNVETMLKKAEKNHFTKAQVLSAMFKGGLTMEDLMGALDSMGEVESIANMIDEGYVQVEPADVGPALF
jgi:hypothetical protein